jgi:phosphoglycerate dehydrogenase-like enzyme
MPSTVAVVTEPEYARAPAVFDAAPFPCHVVPAAESDLARAITDAGARHAIIGGSPYRGLLYDALGRGSVLARFGVGYDGVDLARATAAGILCTNTPSVLDQSVAELTMLLIAAAARRLPAIAGRIHKEVWVPREGIELCGKTLAVIGSGRIGGALARIASGGYGMRVFGCRRSVPATGPGPEGSGFTVVTNDFAEAVRDADFVSLLIPAMPANRHFINRERLALMPARAWLVNTARGMVVDEAALFEAVRDGRLAGAALDVYEREPYVPIDDAHDFRTLENVVLTPHVGSHTGDANRGMASRAVHNIASYEAGRLADMDLLNPEVIGVIGVRS